MNTLSYLAMIRQEKAQAEAKADQRIKIESKVNQESLDKISDSESEIAAILAVLVGLIAV